MSFEAAIPPYMRAAVYRGNGKVVVERVPTPEIGPGEILVRVASCGICHTDLKKIKHDLLPPPRIYGHEIAGVVASVGGGVNRFSPGDRVVVFHHVPCLECFYCRRKLYAQCPVYKRVGVTAGFEPAGGGFAEYVRVMEWIVERGVERIPEGVSFDLATLVEPLNTCQKAVELLAPQPEETVLIQGQGPIGLIFTLLASRLGARVYVTDTINRRLSLGQRFGALEAWSPLEVDVAARLRSLTEGRGADAVIVAASAPGIVPQAIACSRPGARILLFAQTSPGEIVELPGSAICVEERTLFGCYSASIDLQAESARLVFSGELPLDDLISHRVGLEQISEAIELALNPGEQVLKIVVKPQGVDS